jgi:hypothetical protein
MNKWEMTELSRWHKNFKEAQDEILASGWEPFAVSNPGMHGPTIYHFRRLVEDTPQQDKSEDGNG